MKWLTCVSLVFVLAAASQPAVAQGPRQKYSQQGWRRDPNDPNRLVIKYFFKEKPDDSEYQMHEIYYYPNARDPQHRKWLYYYNPDKETFWCRALAYYDEDDRQRGEIWNVVPADAGREKTIQDSYGKNKFTEGMSFKHANIPGTDGTPWEEPMDLPPPPPTNI